MGTLFVVSTPIGNLADLSPRAAEILRTVELVAAEDTRVTRKIIAKAGSRARVLSFHQHSGPSRAEQILEALATGDVAIVTDAGTPAISDPGAELVALADARGITVRAVPGPSAPAAALAVSGLPADRFLFLGFLPRRAIDRRRALAEVEDEPGTLVVFEAPHRLRAALQDVAALLGERRLAVCRELTKLHEETFCGTAEAALEYFEKPRGEFTIVIAGRGDDPEEADDASIIETLRRLGERGMSGRRLVDAAASETGASRRRVYRLAMHPDESPK